MVNISMEYSFYSQVGDEILEINGANSEVMSHSQAVNAIRNSGQTCELLIRRPVKSTTSGIFCVGFLGIFRPS